MAVNGTSHKSANGLSDVQALKLVQKELELTQERLQRERALSSQSRAELLEARSNHRAEKARNEGFPSIS